MESAVRSRPGPTLPLHPRDVVANVVDHSDVNNVTDVSDDVHSNVCRRRCHHRVDRRHRQVVHSADARQ